MYVYFFKFGISDDISSGLHIPSQSLFCGLVVFGVTAPPHRHPLPVGTHGLLFPCWPPPATQGHFCHPLDSLPKLPPVKVCVSYVNLSFKGIINLSPKTVEFCGNEESGG